jgi:hypothetical protein
MATQDDIHKGLIQERQQSLQALLGLEILPTGKGLFDQFGDPQFGRPQGTWTVRGQTPVGRTGMNGLTECIQRPTFIIIQKVHASVAPR